jgi:hypothetical protein
MPSPIADNPGVGPLITTSAFVGTNPTGEVITSGLPVIRAQSRFRRSSVRNAARTSQANIREEMFGLVPVACAAGSRKVIAGARI